jgi:hypothetical protein
MMRPACILLIPAIALLAACADVPGEAVVREAVVTGNRVTANRVTGNRVTANRVAANRVAAHRITAHRLTVDGAANELLATVDGRDLFSVLVNCAIPEGLTLEATVGDTTFLFFGELGLARDWLDHPLDREGRGWVSACVFAKINVRDVLIPISVHGPDHGLATTSDERATWSVEEGAFYGDMFTPLDEPILWIACRGAGQAAGESGGLIDRDCAEEDPAHPGLTQCGFVYAGDCGDFGDGAACEQFSEHGEFYQRCHAAPIDHHHHDGHYGASDHGDDRGQVFREVITTYVNP